MQRMSGAQLALVCKELALLGGKRISKIRKTESGIYLFKIGGEELLFEPGLRIHLTRLKLSATQRPDGFVAYLRKKLEGKIAQQIAQHGNDRIVELVLLSGERLVFELFRKGNLIFVNGSGIIEACSKIDESGGRKVAKGEKYQYPAPTSFQIKLPESMAFRVVEDEAGEPISVSIDADVQGKQFETLSEALDYYYAHAKKESAEEKAACQRLEKLRKRLEEQRAALGQLEKKRKEAREAGEAIYRNFDFVEEVIGLVREMKKMGASEEEINRELSKKKARLNGWQLEIELDG